MDFLWLFTFYLLSIIMLVSIFCFVSGRSRSRLDRIFGRAEEMLSLVLPTWLQSWFQTRSGAFVVLHLILDALVFAEYTWEVFGYCVELEMHLRFLLLPYILISVNLYFFYKCCVTDPGVITKQNVTLFTQVYGYDEILYHIGNVCKTCHLCKPARSKHCGVCGCCVQRFDHHCVWVNNCIGALNIRYFLLYLFSLTLTVLSLAWVITAFLLQVVLLSHMMTAAYVNIDGQEHVMNIAVIIQHLFLTFPRIVFTLGFLIVLVLLVGGYGCFVFYLCLTNQTTNEWYKTRRHASANRSLTDKGYSKGLKTNIQEIFLPHSFYKKGR
ncbi:palmitoyltransferase ZDHHC4 [Pelobates fuscus]|uniref:palmitoyltransferase ZDHHC4 n=1 Tax=Pelobates fuscus TaxID=191477 RepID=UPI002FE4907C